MIDPEEGPIVWPKLIIDAAGPEATKSETTDMVDEQARDVTDFDLMRYSAKHMQIGSLSPALHAESGVEAAKEWWRSLYAKVFPEQFSNRSKGMTSYEIDTALQHSPTLSEMYGRINAQLAQSEEKIVVGFGEKEGASSITCDTIEEALATCRRALGGIRLSMALYRAIKTADSLDQMHAYSRQYLSMGQIHPKMTNYNFLVSSGQWGLAFTPLKALGVYAKFARTHPTELERSTSLAIETINALSGEQKGSLSKLKESLFNRMKKMAADSGKDIEGFTKDDEELIQSLSGDDLFYYLITKRNYPQILTRKYYLSKIPYFAGIEVTDERLPVFKEALEMLTTVDKKGAGKLMADSILLTRRIVDNLASTGSSTAAVKIKAFLDAAETQHTIGPSLVIRLANAIKLPQSVQSGKLHEAKLSDFPQAIARVIYAARLELMIKDKAEDNEKTEDVIDYASQCAVLLAEIGVDNKLSQVVLSEQDLIVRYPKLKASEIKSLKNKLQGTADAQSVHAVYRELKLHSKRSASYDLRTPGKGLLS